MNPTAWNFNPTASTSNIVEYDDSTRPYDQSTQPYDGVTEGESLDNWKNPTSWTSSLIPPAAQQYYGGPTSVPLYAGATAWNANPGIVNQAGQYVPDEGANADLYPYDQSTAEYDSGSRNYDGMNDGKSFDNWKTPTAWTPIAGGNDF
jgi:hypothetical protein